MREGDELAPLPEPRDHLAAVALDGRLYAVAGAPGWLAGQQTSVTLWVYDPERDLWERRAPLPLGRAAHAAVAVGGKLYVVGGVGPEPQRALAYDPATDSWTVLAPMSRPREHLAAAAIDGLIYVVGGRWSDTGNVNLLEVYDPASDTWRALAPMPTPRGGLAAAAVGARLYVTGGEVLDASRLTFGQLEVYDPASDTWAAAPPLPSPRHGLAAVALQGELYVLAGGRLAGLDVSGLTEIFTPAQ